MLKVCWQKEKKNQHTQTQKQPTNQKNTNNETFIYMFCKPRFLSGTYATWRHGEWRVVLMWVQESDRAQLCKLYILVYMCAYKSEKCVFVVSLNLSFHKFQALVFNCSVLKKNLEVLTFDHTCISFLYIYFNSAFLHEENI